MEMCSGGGRRGRKILESGRLDPKVTKKGSDYAKAPDRPTAGNAHCVVVKKKI